MVSFLAFLVIGALAGWIAGNLMKGSGFGLWGNMGVGIVGSLLGGLLFRIFGLAATSFIGSLITATIGAVILLFLIAKYKHKL